MSMVQLPGSSWKFYQNAIVPDHGANADFAKASDDKTGESVFIFKFPYSGRQVELVVCWDSEHKNLKGSYTWDPTSKQERRWNNIEFSVLNDGSILEGTPEGINGLRTWILAYGDTKKGSDVRDNSFCVIS